MKNETPDVAPVFHRELMQLTKTDLIELYFDLYRETHEESATDSEVMKDLRDLRFNWLTQQ